MTPKRFYLPKGDRSIVILNPAHKFQMGERVFVARMNIWGRISKVFENVITENSFYHGTYYGIDIDGGKRTTAHESMIYRDVLGQLAEI